MAGKNALEHPMRVLFFNPTSLVFNVATPQTEPLGGVASCMCHLATAMATRGHDVSLVSLLPEGTPPVLNGVHHLPVKPLWADAVNFFREGNYDVVITPNYPDIAPAVKKGSPHTVTVAWLHVYPDQPALAPLKKCERWLDATVCVSATLRDALKVSIQNVAIGNGISPFFENMFSSADELLAAKKNRAVYASMPFRGLDQLVDVMGRAKTKVELEIYSSMRAYQVQDESRPEMMAIFDAARRNPRIHNRGAVSQRALAEAFRGAAFLPYPCTFIETYCIVAQEALAAGLKVITNDLGALPETTMGFADLLPVNGGVITREDHIAGFVRLLEKAEREFQRDSRAWAEARFAQVQAVNRESTWARRAAQWEGFFAPGVTAIKNHLKSMQVAR